MLDCQLSTGESGLPIKGGNDTIGMGLRGDQDEACARAGLDKVRGQLT